MNDQEHLSRKAAAGAIAGLAAVAVLFALVKLFAALVAEPVKIGTVLFWAAVSGALLSIAVSTTRRLVASRRGQ